MRIAAASAIPEAKLRLDRRVPASPRGLPGDRAVEAAACRPLPLQRVRLTALRWCRWCATTSRLRIELRVGRLESQGPLGMAAPAASTAAAALTVDEATVLMLSCRAGTRRLRWLSRLTGAYGAAGLRREAKRSWGCCKH